METKQPLQNGDWIQLTVAGLDQIDDIIDGQEIITRRDERLGDIAHVLALEPDGTVTVYFERTRCVGFVFDHEFKRLCSGDASELGSKRW